MVIDHGKRCPDKRRYPSIVDALAALVGQLRKRVGVCRCYKCSHCDGWHLTAQPRRTIYAAYDDAAARKILGLRR